MTNSNLITRKLKSRKEKEEILQKRLKNKNIVWSCDGLPNKLRPSFFRNGFEVSGSHYLDTKTGKAYVVVETKNHTEVLEMKQMKTKTKFISKFFITD